MKDSPEKFELNPDQEKSVIELIKKISLSDTAEEDSALIEFSLGLAYIMEETKMSLNDLRNLLEKTEIADKKLINRWLELAKKRGEFEVYNEKQQ